MVDVLQRYYCHYLKLCGQIETERAAAALRAKETVGV